MFIQFVSQSFLRNHLMVAYFVVFRIFGSLEMHFKKWGQVRFSKLETLLER